MGHLIKIFSDWEIKILVLLSFTLQLFLFFCGRLRRGRSNRFLRLCLWAAYLGADLAAVFSLGYLSHHQDVTIERNIVTRIQPLAFFWAPFLLIHLGGQDTLTAFAMEDNNLWLRHLLNLVTQVGVALYVFWKSTGKHSANLILAGSFVFVAGIIKYGERIWSLKCGSLESLVNSEGDHYRKELPQGTSLDVDLVRGALDSMTYVLSVLSERTIIDDIDDDDDDDDDAPEHLDQDIITNTCRLQLGMIYDDVYTKSLALRTWSGVILRCISHAAVIVSFVLFHECEKESYSNTDTRITYSLFIGCFFLEVCSMFVSMMSPWTWAWLKFQKWEALASLSWILFRRDRMKERWPSLIGQYNFHSWVLDSNPQPRTYCQQIMILFRKLFVDLFGVQKNKIFFMSKLLDTEYKDLDNMIVKRVADDIALLVSDSDSGTLEEWANTGKKLKEMLEYLVVDFGLGIVYMHILTEINLKEHESQSLDMESNSTISDVSIGLMDECRKLSRYMIYLLVTQPSMLPLSISAAATLRECHQPGVREKLMSTELTELLQPSKETWEVLAKFWTRLLLYAAGKSRAALHVAQLSGGGELITFVWLLMAHHNIGEYHVTKVELTTNEVLDPVGKRKKLYAVSLAKQDQKAGADNWPESSTELLRSISQKQKELVRSHSL